MILLAIICLLVFKGTLQAWGHDCDNFHPDR